MSKLAFLPHIVHVNGPLARNIYLFTYMKQSIRLRNWLTR